MAVRVLGVTGGIASGKSTACRVLRALAAEERFRVAAPSASSAGASAAASSSSTSSSTSASPPASASAAASSSPAADSRLRVHLVDTDLLGHRAYEPGTASYRAIVAAFGPGVVSAAAAPSSSSSSSSETAAETAAGTPEPPIDRRALGGIVFSSAARMKELTDIVWPAIRELATADIDRVRAEATEFAASSEASSLPPRLDVVVLEAAVLIEGGWHDMCDDVWAFEVPREVAVERLAERNGLSKAEAEKRIDSQLTNAERAAHATEVVDTNRPPEETRKILSGLVDAYVEKHMPGSASSGAARL